MSYDLMEIIHTFSPNDDDQVMLNSQQVVTPYQELEQRAVELVEFAHKYGREPVVIEDYRRLLGDDYEPPCWYMNKRGDNITDTDYNYRDVRALEPQETKNMIAAKQMCASCPLKKYCLAAGMFACKSTRKSKNRPSLPGTDNHGLSVYLNEFCIYGGYTPGERAIMYSMIVYILDVLDGNIQANGTTDSHTRYTTSSRTLG